MDLVRVQNYYIFGLMTEIAQIGSRGAPMLWVFMLEVAVEHYMTRMQ